LVDGIVGSGWTQFLIAYFGSNNPKNSCSPGHYMFISIITIVNVKGSFRPLSNLDGRKA